MLAFSPAEVNCTVWFSSKPVVMFWFRPMFQEWTALPLMLGKKFPKASFLSISATWLSKSACLIEILLSNAYCTHSCKVHFFA